MSESSLSIEESVAKAAQRLQRAGIEDSTYEAKRFMQHCLNVNSAYLIVHADRPIDAIHRSTFEQWIARRVLGEPFAYIVGTCGFWDLELYCDNSTLIPRADTETLVEWALSLPMTSRAKVLDLGTGTGAIALALAKERPTWQVSAIDCIHDAVLLARKNALHNGLNVAVYQSDWFATIEAQKFDLIVSNPPYVEPDSEYLMRGDLRFEPKTALVAGDDGFSAIRKIIQSAKQFLVSGGWLLIEHGDTQAHKVTSEFAINQYCDIATHTDLNGRDRVTGGRLL